MSWRKPPKIAVRGMKESSNCPGKPSTPRPRSGSSKPKDTPAEAQTPRTRTTVTKTRSTPGGVNETTTVERVQSGPAAMTQPRYNKQKVMHPEDAYRERKMKPPCKPDKPCPKVKKGEYYSKEEVGLWEQWQQWNEYKEEVKCWQQNRPYVSGKQKEEQAFKRWLQKEEEAHERLFKAGKSQVMPFHMRPEKKPKKAATPGKSPPIRCLPKSPKGKKRYEKKDCMGNYIRYNSVDDPNPEDLYNAQGLNPPEYVQPPLKEDGTFKLPKERTEEESDAFTAYRKWEEFYFRQQAWDNDKKWQGDPRIQELFNIKTPSGRGRADTPSSRAEERAAERASRKANAQAAQKEKLSKAEKAKEANLRKMGLKGRKLSGAARVAMECAAKREAAERAAEEAKQQELQQRQKSFLKRGQRCGQAMKGGRIDLSKVQSRIGGMIRANRARTVCEDSTAQVSQVEEPCGPDYPIPSPPGKSYDLWEMNRQDAMRQRRSNAFCNRMSGQIARHLNLTGQMGHLPTTVNIYDVGQRPRPVRGFDVSILNYLPSTPPASLFGGPGPMDGDVELGCDEQPSDWYAPDEPITPFGNRTFEYMQHISPPRSIRKGRLPHQPMHGSEVCRETGYGPSANEQYLARQEVETADECAYLDRVMDATMNRPLRERAAAMAAQTDVNLLHPAVFQSNIMQRQDECRQRGAIAAGLAARAQEMQNIPLPNIERRRVARAWNVATPPCTPEPPPCPSPALGQLINFDEEPCAPPPPPRTPPLPMTPPPCGPSPQPQTSPFVMPERFAGGCNPYLEQARAAIAAPCQQIPFRGEEIAAQAARTAAAAQPRRQPDLFGGWEAADFEADMREVGCLDTALENMEPSPCTPASQGDWHWPEYRQSVGPQYGALYHEHIRQPQLGPWHYTPPGGRALHGLMPAGPNLC